MSKYQGKTRSGKPIKSYRKRADFILEGQPMGVNVPSEESGDLEKALKVFKRQLKNQGIFEELRERRYYEKPSAARYKAKNTAIRTQQNQERKNRAMDKRYKTWTAIVDGQAM
jgi:small subunit ribosomal protein S21